MIDNIAVLKFCKENGIKNNYNLMVRYPNEEQVDFDETKKIVQMLKGYLDAPQLCELRVMHGSLIQRHPEQFNIERLEHASIDLNHVSFRVFGEGICFCVRFQSKDPIY